MMSSHHHLTSGGWIIAILVAVLILGLVVVAVVWTNRKRSDRRGGGSTGAPSAREILDRRLASGEIKTDQYVELRGLSRRPPSHPRRATDPSIDTPAPLSPDPPTA
jgi:uncharacterized membrane protein